MASLRRGPRFANEIFRPLISRSRVRIPTGSPNYPVGTSFTERSSIGVRTRRAPGHRRNIGANSVLFGLLYQRPTRPGSATPRLGLALAKDLRPSRVGAANHLIEFNEPKKGHSLVGVQR